MREVVMQTTEPFSTRELLIGWKTFLENTDTKAYLEQVVYNASQINSEKKTQLLGILKDFFDLFDGTLGYWYIEHADLELNTCYKPFDCKYYSVPEINK